MEFLEHPFALLIVAVLSYPVYKSLAKVFFGEQYEDFGKTIRYVATADWYSLIRGEFWQD
jgi:hypothetical protein